MNQENISGNDQMLEYQLNQLQQILNNIDNQLIQIQETKRSLLEFDSIEPDQELLYPLANGIYAKGLTSNDKMLKVNIGSNIVVDKTIPDTIAMFDSQISELENYKKEVSNQFEKLIKRMG